MITMPKPTKRPDQTPGTPETLSLKQQTGEAQPPQKKRGPKPGTATARKGGLAAARKYGREFYAQIGRKGGETVKASHSPEYYSELGRKGGQTTSERHGGEFYSAIGRKGGKASRRRGKHDNT